MNYIQRMIILILLVFGAIAVGGLGYVCAPFVFLKVIFVMLSIGMMIYGGLLSLLWRGD